MKIKKDGYKIVNRESEIDNLIKWMGETESNNDRFLMKEDLRELMTMTCENVYSNESTNEYIAIN